MAYGPNYPAGSNEASYFGLGSSSTTVASNFNGGYEIEGNLGTGVFNGRPVSIINADDFVIEHPEFVTFYKDRKKVGLRRLDEISRIVAR